jgi:hypothetical protein
VRERRKAKGAWMRRTHDAQSTQMSTTGVDL